MEDLYEFIPPDQRQNRDKKLIPNQLGELCSFNDLFTDENIPNEFKVLLRDYFELDIRNILEDANISIKVAQSLRIDSPKIADQIRSIFSRGDYYYKREYDRYHVIQRVQKKYDISQLERSQKFIIFQPNFPNSSVSSFIKCYKELMNLDFEPITISTQIVSFWNVPIKELSELIIQQIKKDKTLQQCAKRIHKTEKEVIELLNIFYPFCESDSPIFPNRFGEFCLQTSLYQTDVDEQLLEIEAKINSPENCLKKVLVHSEINSHFYKKTIKDIADIIDNAIRSGMKKLQTDNQSDQNNNNNNNQNLNPDFKEGCQMLIMEWFNQYPQYQKLFPYVEKRKMDLIMEFSLDAKTKKSVKSLMSKMQQQEDPVSNVMQIMKTNPARKTVTKESAKTVCSFIQNLQYNDDDIDFLQKHSDAIHSFMSDFTADVGYSGELLVYEKLIESGKWDTVHWNALTNRTTSKMITSPRTGESYYLEESGSHEDIIVVKGQEEYRIEVKSTSKINQSKFNFMVSQRQIQMLEGVVPNSHRLLAFVIGPNSSDPSILFLENHDLLH